MARRYDSSTTTFSPEGRLHQVEYAIEAINNAGTCVGILAKDGVVMASERRVTSGLLAPAKTSEKTYKLCSHAACTVAGLTADANILIDEARLRAGRYEYQYQEHIPIEQLVEHVCNYKQAYTQYGGLRPFGVAFLFAGYDETHGFQLYQSDPSGNYSGWKATVIGANNQAGKSLLKTEYGSSSQGDEGETKMEEEEKKDEDEVKMPDLPEALRLAVKVLNKTMDGTAASLDKMELFSMTLDEDGSCVHRILGAEEVQAVIDEVEAEAASAGDA
mmetsp:Transcript_16959/g.22496  ORF Transcript_16959/g.22496 Transcript_16959/m.22496 type:complete len:274 (+) Transcript_16959:76-897(+)